MILKGVELKRGDMLGYSGRFRDSSNLPDLKVLKVGEKLLIVVDTFGREFKRTKRELTFYKRKES